MILDPRVADKTQIGSAIDSITRARLRNWLKTEIGGEGASAVAQVNRWLRDPTPGSSLYRIPDARSPGHIFDLTIGYKDWSTPQILDFSKFSGGNKITIVRPNAYGGPYSLIGN